MYAGRRANGTPIQVTKTLQAKEARPGAGKRRGERELAAMVADVSKGNVTTGTKRSTISSTPGWHISNQIAPRPPCASTEISSDQSSGPNWGKFKLKVLSARQLDALYAKLTKKGNKASTVRRVHALIAAALHQAERWDMIDNNVTRRASPPPIRQERFSAPPPKRYEQSSPPPRS